MALQRANFEVISNPRLGVGGSKQDNRLPVTDLILGVGWHSLMGMGGLGSQVGACPRRVFSLEKDPETSEIGRAHV